MNSLLNFLKVTIEFILILKYKFKEKRFSRSQTLLPCGFELSQVHSWCERQIECYRWEPWIEQQGIYLSTDRTFELILEGYKVSSHVKKKHFKQQNRMQKGSEEGSGGHCATCLWAQPLGKLRQELSNLSSTVSCVGGRGDCKCGNRWGGSRDERVCFKYWQF